jgi:NitT/TauT family transport system ATP-binding protein
VLGFEVTIREDQALIHPSVKPQMAAGPPSSFEPSNVVQLLGSPGSHAIAVKGLSKRFQTKAGLVTALSDLNLAVDSGQFLSVVGPSGCGKSTLLKIVAGLVPPSSGIVEVGGMPVLKPYTNVGIVFQRDLLLESRTAIENILLQVEMRGLSVKQYVDKAKDLLEKVGLADFAEKYPRELSGGMRQRVSICRALIHDPPLLLMDEPFGSLDALTRDEIALDLAWLCERSRKTVLFITHSISEAVFLSDRVIVMTARPAAIVKDMIVDLPRPRSIEQRGSAEFEHHLHQIRELLFHKRKS